MIHMHRTLTKAIGCVTDKSFYAEKTSAAVNALSDL